MNRFRNLRAQIAGRIAMARQFRGWATADLACRTGMKQRRLQACEKTGDMDCHELEVIAVALDLPLSHFLTTCILCGAEIDSE